MATRATKAVPMCCVRIGYETLLMPVSKGAQLLSLLREAVSCKEDYMSGIGRQYIIGGQLEVEIATVKADQVRRAAMPGRNGDPLAIGNNPSPSFDFD